MPSTDEVLPPVIGVKIVAPEVERSSRQSDRAGLVIALIELGLTDLEGVVPQVGDLPPVPSLINSPPPESVWTLTLTAAGSLAEGRLCAPDGSCTTAGGAYPLETDPTPAVSAILVHTAEQLGRTAIRGADQVWRDRGTKDDYAALMAGRGAAIVYGLRDAPEPDKVGDKKADPIMRAFLIDPGMPVSGWVAARSGRVGPDAALRRSMARRPQSVIFPAEIALTLPNPLAARTLHDDVLRSAPRDRRFLVDIAANRLTLGRPIEASKILNALGPGASRSAAVAKLRVAIADATGDHPDESLLQDWRTADPLDPVPVRRLVRRRVEREDYAGARELVADLATRATKAEADAMDLALQYALGRHLGASTVAAAAGDAVLAADLRQGPPLIRDRTRTLPTLPL